MFVKFGVFVDMSLNKHMVWQQIKTLEFKKLIWRFNCVDIWFSGIMGLLSPVSGMKIRLWAQVLTPYSIVWIFILFYIPESKSFYWPTRASPSPPWSDTGSSCARSTTVSVLACFPWSRFSSVHPVRLARTSGDDVVRQRSSQPQPAPALDYSVKRTRWLVVVPIVDSKKSFQ